jgi:hypothetical protein
LLPLLLLLLMTMMMPLACRNACLCNGMQWAMDDNTHRAALLHQCSCQYARLLHALANIYNHMNHHFVLFMFGMMMLMVNRLS